MSHYRMPINGAPYRMRSPAMSGRSSDGESDPFFPNVQLLLHFDGANGSTSIVDSSSFNRAASVFGTTSISTAQSQFGGSSIFFNSSTAYIGYASDAAWDLGTGDFAVENWIYQTSITDAYKTVWGSAGYASNITGSYRLYTFGNDLEFWIRRSGAFFRALQALNCLTFNTWQYIGLKRTSLAFELTVGGTTVATNSISDSLSDSSGFHISSNQSTFSWAGYQDEFRITKGVARDISATPVTPFPNS